MGVVAVLLRKYTIYKSERVFVKKYIQKTHSYGYWAGGVGGEMKGLKKLKTKSNLKRSRREIVKGKMAGEMEVQGSEQQSSS